MRTKNPRFTLCFLCSLPNINYKILSRTQPLVFMQPCKRKMLPKCSTSSCAACCCAPLPMAYIYIYIYIYICVCVCVCVCVCISISQRSTFLSNLHLNQKDERELPGILESSEFFWFFPQIVSVVPLTTSLHLISLFLSPPPRPPPLRVC
jgi:hypothetical protein